MLGSTGLHGQASGLQQTTKVEAAALASVRAERPRDS
jgi:hypothetical protein